MLFRAFLLTLFLTAFARAGDLALIYRDCKRIDDKRITGLSGITYASGEKYWGVLEKAKLVELQIHLGNGGDIESVAVNRIAPLAKGRDVEGIAFHPSRPDSVFVSDES